jgi:FG-GAP-like repeat
MRKLFHVDGMIGQAQTPDMKRTTGILLLVLTGLAFLPQTALAGQFKKPVYYSAPGLPEAIVAADFDHDTNLDLAVADFGNEFVGTLLGKGDGSFRKGPSFPITYPYAPVGLAIGDFDGDQTPDLAVVEYNGPGVGKLGIFLGNGDGTFHQWAEYQLGTMPLFAAVADFDGDGHLDIAVTNEGSKGSGTVMVFFGKGDGTFRGPTTYKLSSYPYSVAAGDLNGDGRVDLAVAVYNSGVAVLLNKGSGKFRKPVLYPINFALVTSVAITELNHDNHPDLVVATFQAVGVLLGTGGGKFGKAALYSTASITREFNPYVVAVADFNLDGNLDIATVLTGGNSALFYGRGNGKFGSAVPIKLKNGGGLGIATGDFNKDAAPDLAIAQDGTAQIAVLLNAQ